jgi:hypothetical protein
MTGKAVRYCAQAETAPNQSVAEEAKNDEGLRHPTNAEAKTVQVHIPSQRRVHSTHTGRLYMPAGLRNLNCTTTKPAADRRLLAPLKSICQNDQQ